MNKYLNIAFQEALNGLQTNDGGPFGAVIVKDGQVISQAHNQVIGLNDPTAHAEIQAIRQACDNLQAFNLSDCQIYSTCQPCPMCLAAIAWAKISKIYYGCTENDANQIGFADKKINQAQIKTTQMDREECLVLFKEWKDKKDKIEY